MNSLETVSIQSPTWFQPGTSEGPSTFTNCIWFTCRWNGCCSDPNKFHCCTPSALMFIRKSSGPVKYEYLRTNGNIGNVYVLIVILNDPCISVEIGIPCSTITRVIS